MDPMYNPKVLPKVYSEMIDLLPGSIEKNVSHISSDGQESLSIGSNAIWNA